MDVAEGARPSRGWRTPSAWAARATASSRRRAPRGRPRARPRSVSSVWLIVPRPGRATITSGRPSSTTRSRTSVPPTVNGTSSPPTPSTMRRPAVAVGARCVDQHGGVDRHAGQLGGEVRRDGGAEAVGRDLGRGHPGAAGEQLVVGRLVAGLELGAEAGRGGARLGLVVEPGDDRLEGTDQPLRARRSAAISAAATTVLPTSVSVPVTKSPRIALRTSLPKGSGSSCRAPCRSTRPGPIVDERRAHQAAAASSPATARRSSGWPAGAAAATRHADARPEARLQRGAAEGPGRGAQLLARVGRHHRQAQPRGAGGHGRRPDRLGEDAGLDRASRRPASPARRRRRPAG